MNYPYSYGNKKLYGIISNISLHFLFILYAFSMFFFNKSFLVIYLFSKKWLILYHTNKLSNCKFILDHVHNKFHELFNSIPCGNSFHLYPIYLPNTFVMISYTSGLSLTTLKYNLSSLLVLINSSFGLS
jgi:hypothetical protein